MMWLNLAQIPCDATVGSFYQEMHILLSPISKMDKSVLRLIALLIYMESFLRFLHKSYHHSSNFIHLYLYKHNVALDLKKKCTTSQSVH